MSEKPAIYDEPLPAGELVAAGTAPVTAPDPGSQPHASTPQEQPPGHTGLQSQLPEAHLDKAVSSYGHTDPASLAAGISLDLHDPDLKEADKDALNQPIWSQSGTAAAAADASPAPETAASPWSQMPPVLAHPAQVGLTSADQWEEQIQPRLQKLYEDNAQVHALLDVLERQKPKK